MTVFTKPGQQIFAPVDESGNARSVSNQEAQVWSTEVERSIVGAAAGLVRSATLAGLPDGTRVGQPGEVTAGADIGAYTWDGSEWDRVGDIIDPAALQADIDTKADLTALAATNDAVALKAAQSALDATNATITTKQDASAPLAALSTAPEATAEYVAEGIRRTTDGTIETIDEDGFVGHSFDVGGLSVPGLSVVDDGRPDLSISDPDGFVGFILGEEGLYVGAISDDGDIISAEFSDADIKTLNAECLAASALAQRPVQTYLQRTTFFYNSIFSYGQSLSNGWEGWPRLSTAAVPGLYMIGDSPRPNHEDNPEFVPIGSAVLNALTATVQVSGTLYNDAAVAAFIAGDNARGETIGDGAVRAFRLAQLQHFAVDADASRNYIYSACGSGGNSMGDLTYGATPHLFNRLIDAAELVKGIADAAVKTSGAAAVLWNQGEADYIDGTEPDIYKAGLSQIIDDFHDQVQVGVFDASRPAAWFTCQTGAYYARDNLEIAQAQRELADERQDVYMVAPNYAATDKGDHLDSNGYRWLACQTAKVMHLVLNLGQNWLPLQERRVLKSRSSALIGFTVPVPPLQWRPVYEASTPVIYDNKGFTAMDGAGALSVTSVAIVADCVVQLIFGREIVGDLTVVYANKTDFFGGGNLADSDPTVAPFTYEYLPGTGMYAEANIPELVGKPYPLNNFCLAFARLADA